MLCLRSLKSQICILFLYKFVVYVLLLKTRTTWCWNFFRKAQYPRIALLLSALDVVVMFSFDKRVCFSLNYWSRATQYSWHTFPLFFVKHDCSCKYSAHFCVLITALYMIRRITLIIQRLNHSFSRTVVRKVRVFKTVFFSCCFHETVKFVNSHCVGFEPTFIKVFCSMINTQIKGPWSLRFSDKRK